MREILFTVMGNPKALKRHRTFRRGNFTGQYDPSKDDKNNFLALAKQHRPEKPIDTPIKLTATFYFGRPKSHYGTGKNADNLRNTAPNYHISRPDVDNLFKFIADALNGVFWKDDSQICVIQSEKKYCTVPRTEIKIIY